MGDEFKDLETAVPTLTLEPDIDQPSEVKAAMAQAAQQEAPKAAEPKAEEIEVPEPYLTEAERKMVDDFSKKIDIENSNQVLQYGAGTQKKMADFSDAALANVRTQDLGEVGGLLANVVGELKDFDALEEEKGFFGFFKKQTNKLENLKNRYAKAEVNVDKITEALQEHQIRLMKDSALLEKMYEENLNYYKELTMYVLAGKKRLKEVREGQLREMEAKALKELSE